MSVHVYNTVTLRDAIALDAMKALIPVFAPYAGSLTEHAGLVAQEAYIMADAMIKQSQKGYNHE